jgi:hypothetical protein
VRILRELGDVEQVERLDRHGNVHGNSGEHVDEAVQVEVAGLSVLVPGFVL